MHLRTAVCLLLAVIHVSAQTPPPTVPAAAQRYLDILIKRPQPGTIYERFYAAWLEESTPVELGAFLTAQTTGSKATAADHLLLAVFQSHRGDDRAALTAYEAALKLDPGNAAAWIERSRLESRALDFATALKSLDEAAKARPEAALLIETGKLRGRALLRLGKNEEALRTWKELSAAHADDEDLAEEMVDLLTDEGQYEAALEAAQALMKRSRDPVAKTLRQLRLTDILLLAERRDDALKALREALAATGADTWIEGDVLDRMSRVFRMSDDVSGLEKFLAELVKEHPQRVALSWQHTQLLGETGQKDAALKQARALLQSNPGRRDLQEGFLALLESLDLIQEAVEQARALVQQNAGDKEMRVRLATLQHRAKDDVEAQKSLEHFLAIPGTGEADHLRVARLLENWEDPPTKAQSPAALAYARLVEKFPDSISAQEAQAHYLHRVGQREAALAIWTRLAKSAALEDLLRIAQALQARLETRTALDLLMPRERDFATEARFFALLVQLGIANKELERTLPWARTRLRLAKDAEAIETAIKDLMIVLRGEESAKLHTGVLQELQKATALTIQDRCLLAALLEDGGKSAEAEKSLSDAPEADRLIALSQLAQLLQTRQEWEKAAQTLQQVIALPDARTSARVQRIVDFYRRAAKPEEALKWIAEWKKLSPSAVQPWLDESRLLLELNRPKDALTLLRGAMRKFPDSIETASSYATLCLENGQPDEAERTYLALYEKTTDAATRLRLLGPLALAAQQHNGLPRLIENFQQRQKQNRASAQPWLALAEIQRTTGNDEERRRCLYEASRLRPQDIGLLQEIARSEEEVGLTAEALRTLEAAAKLDKTTKTREQIARLQIDGGDADAGYRMLFELAGGSQMDARGIEQMADTIAEKGEWERVISFLEPLLPKHPKDYRLHYLNAIALEEAGRERDAVRAFLALLDLHEELPGVLSTGRSFGLRQQYASRHLPPGAEDWLMLPGMMQFSYAHRQKAGQRSRGGYYGGYFGQQVNNGLPRGFIEHAPGVAESPVLALVHLLQIAGGWDPQERAALVPRLSQAGVSDAALLLEAAQESPQLIITPEMLAAHPQNATLHSVWLMQHRQGEPEELLPIYENAWKLFQATNPAQAQNIALRAWYIAGEKSGAWLQRIMGIIEAMPKADAETFQSIASMLQGQNTVVETGTAAPRLKPEEITRFSHRLLEWYHAKTPTDGYHASAILSALAVAQDWPGMVEVMRLALVASQDKSATATQQPAIYLNHRRSGFGGGMTLQPQPLYSVPGLSMELAGFTNQLQGISPYREEMQEVPVLSEAVKERVKAMQDGLRPFIAKADSPPLKFILQLMCGEEAALAKDLNTRLQAKDVTADDFLTAGWLAQRTNEHAEAVAHFTQALQRTTDANAKQPIENALLYHAQRLVQKEQDEAKITPVRTQAKALLDSHLQRAKTDDEKYQIAQVMGGIGLAEEAQAIQEAVQAARNSMSTPARQRSTPVANPYSSNRAYYQRQQQAQKTPEQLVKEGKNELAVKESTRQLRAAIQQTLSPQNGTSGHQQLHQVMNEAVKLKLWDDVAKGLRDVAEGGWRSRLEYAVMLEHVGNDSAPALAEHRGVIAANPRAYDSHTRLAVVLSYEGKFDEAVRHWRAVPAMQQEMMLPGIVHEFIQRHDFAVPRPDALSGLLCAWLKGLEPNRLLSMNLLQHLNQTLQYLQQADGGANLSYPSLYEPWHGDSLTEERRRWKLNADGSLALDEASAKDRATRRKAHDDLCRAMLTVPELAQMAFPPLAGLALADGDAKTIAELETTALDLLTRLTMPKIKRRLNTYGQNNIYNSSNAMLFSSRNRIFMPDAALFLVRASALRQDTRALDDTLYPLITRVHGKPRAAHLKGYANLLMSKDDGFIAAAESWLKQQHAYAINNEGGAHDEVLRLWLERKIAAPLDALYPSKSSATYGYNIPHAVTAYVMALGQRDTGSMRQFVRKLRDQWLGADAEARRKAVSGWFAAQNDQRRRNSYYRQPGMKEQAVNAYIQWMQNLLQQPRGLPLLEIAFEDGLDSSPGWLRQIAYQHSNSDRINTSESFLQTARIAGFLNDAARLRAYDISEAGEHNQTWLGNLARQFRERSDDAQLNSTLELLGKQPRTLGGDLMQALLVKNSRTPLWLDGKPVPFEAGQVARFPSDGDENKAHRASALEIMLTRHAKDLAAMPAAGQHDLGVLLRGELSGYPQPEKLGETLTLVLAPLLKAENLASILQADFVLKARTFSDIGQQEYRFTEQFPALLKDVARLDLAKAEAAARHAVELLRSSPEQKQTLARRNNTPPTHTYLHTLAQVPQLLAVIFELAEADGLTRSSSWRSNLRSRLEQMAHHQDQAMALFTHTPFVAEAAAFRDLADMDDNEPTLLAHLINAVENNDACAAAVREHLSKQPATFGTELLLAFFHRAPGDDRYARSFYNSKRPNDAALLAFILKRGLDFAKLQPETAASLFALLNARLMDLKTKAAQDAALQSALKPLVEVDARQFEAEITRWMQIASLHEAGVQEYEATQKGVRLLDRLAQADKPRAVALLDQISKLLAQQEAQNNRGGQRQPPHQTQVAQWLQRAAAVPELFGEVMQRGEESGAAKDSEWMSSTLNNAHNLYKHRGKPQRVIALLEAAGMLDPAATFNPRPMPKNLRQRTMLEQMSGEFTGGSTHPGLVEALSKRQPSTFGVDLVLLFSSKQLKAADEISAFAKAHADEIAAASAEQQKIIAEIFERRKWAETIVAHIPALRDEFGPILREQEARAQAFMNDLLKTQKWQEIEGLFIKTLAPNNSARSDFENRMRPGSFPPYYPPGQSSPAITYLTTQLVSLAATAPDQARQGVLHVSSLYRAEFGQTADPYRKPPLDSFLVALCASPRLAPAVLQLAAQTKSSVVYSSRTPLTEYTLMDAVFPGSTLADVEKISRTLDEIGLLTDAAAFDAIPLPGLTTRSVLGLALWRLSRMNAEMREQTARMLTASKDAKFGHHLLAVLITAKDAAEKTSRLDLCAAQFAKVKPQTAGAILSVFQSDFPALFKAETADDELKPFAPLFQLRAAEERAYLDAVLAGKPGATPPFRGYPIVVTQELVRLMTAAKPDEAVHLVSALRPQIESQTTASAFGTSSYYRDGEKLSEFVRMLPLGPEHSAALLACQLHAAARLPEIRTMPDRMHAQGYSGGESELFQLWERRGGWAAPTAVFSSLIQEVERFDITHTRGLWLPLLHDALTRMGTQELRELAAWAASQDSPGGKIVATELALTIALMEATEPLQAEPRGARLPASSQPAIKAFATAAKTASTLLNDEHIAPHVRLALAGFLAGIYPGLLDEAALQTWGLAAAQAWHDGTPITRFELESLLNAAAVLPMNETWQRTSSLALKRWNQREEIVSKAKTRYIESGFHPFLLRFAARTGASDILDPLLKRSYGHDTRRSAGILLECGVWRQVVEPRVRLSLYSIASYADVRSWWLPPAAAQLKALQAASTEDALLAEVIALAADDATTRILYPHARWPARDERFDAYAKKLAATPIPAQATQRAHALVALGLEHTPAALALLPQFDAVAKVFMSDSLPEDQAGMRCWSDFLAVHAALKLARGDFTVADTHFQRLKTDPGVRRRYGSSSTSIEGEFRNTLFFCLAQLWQAGMARDPAKIAQFVALTGTAAGYSDSNLSAPLLRFALKAWESVLKAEPLPADITPKIEQLGAGIQVIELVTAIAGSGKTRLSFQQRLHLFTLFSGQTNLSAYVPKIWDDLILRQFFAAEELLKQREALLQSARLFAPSHLDELAAFMRRHHALETAVIVGEMAAKQASRTKASSFYSNRYLLDRAATLIRLKKLKEARDCLDQMNDTDRTTSNLAKREALLKMLP